MIILDTNVISEFTRLPSPVADWVSTQDSRALRLVSTSITEIVFGIERMPNGRRRDGIRERWAEVEGAWSARILDVTTEDAHVAGHVLALREAQGRRVHLGDAQIAGGCLARGAALATRNIKDFEGLGIELINPWER